MLRKGSKPLAETTSRSNLKGTPETGEVLVTAPAVEITKAADLPAALRRLRLPLLQNPPTVPPAVEDGLPASLKPGWDSKAALEGLKRLRSEAENLMAASQVHLDLTLHVSVSTKQCHSNYTRINPIA